MGQSLTYAMVIMATVLWGANFNLSKPVLAELHPLLAGTLRFIVAAAFLLTLAAWQRQPVRLIRHIRAYGTLGVLGVVGFNLLFFYGMQRTSAINGALIMATNPLVTALLAATILGERLSARQIMAFPLALAGVGVVVLGDGASLVPAVGDQMIMAANLLWAVYNILAKRMMPTQEGGLANTAALMMIGTLVMIPLTLIAAPVPPHLPDVRAILALIAMAVGGSALSYLFWNAALSRLGVSRTALFLNLVPVAAMVISTLGGTIPAPVQLVGAALTLGAVSMAMMPGGRRVVTA